MSTDFFGDSIRRSFDGNPSTPEKGKEAASAPDASPVMPDADADAPEVVETSAYGETASAYEAGPESTETGSEPESRELTPARTDDEKRIPTVLAVPAKVLDAITEPEQALQFVREAYEAMMSYSPAQTLLNGGGSAETPLETGRILTPDAVVENVENVENFSTSVEKSVETRPLDCGKLVEIPLFVPSGGSGTSGKRMAGLPETGTPDCPKSAPIKNKKNNNNLTENNQSNPPAPSKDWRPPSRSERIISPMPSPQQGLETLR